MSQPGALLLLDSHPVFLAGLASVAGKAWPQVALYQTSCFAEATQQLRTAGVDCVLANWETLSPGQLPRLVQSARDVPVLVTAHGTHDGAASACIQAGARGYLPRTMRGEAICSGVIVALSGGVCFPNSEIANLSPSPKATQRVRGRRELEVLGFLNEGLSNKAIARELGLSLATVKLHVQSILRSTGARSRFEAVINARRMGLLSSR